ncbi:ABC transporter permease [Streptomyces sp. ODS28]|uniref:ABC transporter permease n=1 Tax=Streptomyces sp. ODS28 TaxID=3136688 RepID=UPI0031EF913A
MAHATRVLRSEWTKVSTVRSTPWTLLTAFLATTVLAGVICYFTRSQVQDMHPVQRMSFDPTFTSFAGMGLGQLAMIAFGVMSVSAEYSTGMIRSSLSAVPQRGTFMACKIAVTTLLVLVVGLVTSFLSFFVGQAMLGDYGADLGDPGVLRAVFGGGLYMALIALFSMGVAFVLRSPLLTLAILMPFFFLVSTILDNVPATKKVAQYLPDQAGTAVMAVLPESLDRPYGPWGGLLILIVWTAAALVAGYAVLKRRDA